MEIRIDSYMIDDLNLTGYDLLLYAAIVSNLDANNRFYMKIRDLSKATGIPDRCISRHLSYLRQNNLIKIEVIRDGGFIPRNIITVKDAYIELDKDETYNNIIDYWNLMCLESATVEAKKMARYIIYKKAIKKYTVDEIIGAITSYWTMIKDELYYRSYLFKFDRFIDSKIDLFIPGGIEFESYKVFKDKQKTPFTASDRKFNANDYKNIIISDDQLGNVEI